jgi:hypothetical protein
MFTIKAETANYENKTIRLRTDTIEKLEQLAANNNISFNKVVSQCIDYALANMAESSANTSDLTNH